MSFDLGTLALQAVNVLILIWLLQRFFWRPVAAIIAQRGATTAAMLDEAAKRETKIAAEEANIAQVRRSFADERAALLAAAQADVEEMRRHAEADATDAAHKLKMTIRERMAGEQASARSALQKEAASLAVDIAARLVARLDTQALRSAFLDGALKEVAALPEMARRNPGALTVVTAAPLSTDEHRTYSRRLQEAFGDTAPVNYMVDPDLIAGLELRGDLLRISNNWRNDLARIREGLTNEH